MCRRLPGGLILQRRTCRLMIQDILLVTAIGLSWRAARQDNDSCERHRSTTRTSTSPVMTGSRRRPFTGRLSPGSGPGTMAGCGIRTWSSNCRTN